MAGCFGVGEGGGERGPARLRQDPLGELRHRFAQGGGMPPVECWGQKAAPLMEDGHRVAGCGLVGGAQVFGGLEGSGGLLGMFLLSVPGRGSGDEEEGHVDQHCGARPVLPAAERRSAVDEVAGSLAQGAVVPACGPDVGAAGSLECEGSLAQLLAGVSGGSLGERVQDLASRRDVCGDDLVVTAVEHQDRLPRGGGRGPSRGSGPGHRAQRCVSRAVFAVLGGGCGGRPAFADAGQGQVGSELGARVEDGFAVLVAVVGQRHGVAQEFPGGCDLGPDEQAGGGQAVEELLLALGAGHRAPYGLPQLLAGGAIPLLPVGLVAFGAGRALGCSAVTGVQAPQTVVDLDLACLGLGTLAVLAQPRLSSVLADGGGDDVDVVVRVPHGGPAASGRIPVGGDAGGGDHAPGDVRPLLVAEDRILRGGAYGQVPHVLGGAFPGGEGLDGLVEEMLEVGVSGVGVAAGVGGQVVPRGDEVRVGVLFVGAGPVEVVEQPNGASAHLVDARDHPARVPVPR